MVPVNPAVKRFIAHKRFFRCPLCKGRMVVQGGSLACKKKHCFDISAKGYVNFLPGQGIGGNQYDKALFQSRGEIFAAGFYDRVLAELREMILTHTPACKPLALLDAGCGEGFYAAALTKSEGLQGRAHAFALDNVKAAVQLACRAGGQTTCLVANLADIPLQTGQLDVILNILAPANYGEFLRLLSPEGVLIKVVPGACYLAEIRQLLADKLAKGGESEQSDAYFKRQVQLIEARQVRYTLPVTKEQARLFLKMTPMTFHLDTRELDIACVHEITIDLLLLAGRKRNKDTKERRQNG